jgi:hypothetical protein
VQIAQIGERVRSFGRRYPQRAVFSIRVRRSSFATGPAPMMAVSLFQILIAILQLEENVQEDWDYHKYTLSESAS